MHNIYPCIITCEFNASSYLIINLAIVVTVTDYGEKQTS